MNVSVSSYRQIFSNVRFFRVRSVVHEAVGENCFGLRVSDRFYGYTPLESVIIGSGSLYGKVG
jgi:hypothetical protein